MTDALLAASHFTAILVMVTFLSIETALARPAWMPAAVERLPRYDRLYQLTLALVLITGILRLFAGAKGATFYLANPLFHVKISLFVVMILLALPVSRQLRAWQRARRSDPDWIPAQPALRRLRILLMLAAHLLVLIPILAALMARGYGLG